MSPSSFNNKSSLSITPSSFSVNDRTITVGSARTGLNQLRLVDYSNDNFILGSILF